MEPRDSSRPIAAIALAASVAIAFLLRVLPSYGLVFTHGIVNFQEPDAWFHVRTVHNLLAHFPRRSGFDPYGLFPGGQDVPTGPVWDYLLAIPAWILGWGAPSPALIDQVAAWLPAVLGALYPLPAYFLARRLFGATAAAFAALWTATGFGVFLWLTHLGLADHHAAEGFFAFLTLAWMCAAVDQAGSRFAWLGGIALGLYMGTRPAGIFVPATLACLVVVEPSTAPAVLRAAVAGAAIFLPMSASLWSAYSWLSFAAVGGLAAAIALLEWRARKSAWTPLVRRLSPWAVLAAAAAAAWLAMPHLFASLWYEIHRILGGEPGSRIVATVQEMQPVYRAGQRPGWLSIFEMLGIAWIPALAMAWELRRQAKRPAVKLLTLWTAVMALGTILQVRLALYFLPVAFVLAGAACAWAVERVHPRARVILAAAIAVLVLAVNVPLAIVQFRHDGGLDDDWLEAFHWLRDNSPEPMPDPADWSRYDPHLATGAPRPSAAWGVAIWCDHSYAMEELTHRIPMSNGTQAGAVEMARFYTETVPEAAVGWLRRTGGRYVVVDPQAVYFAGRASHFPAQIAMLGRDFDTYMQFLAENDGTGRITAVPVYLPAYYQTMAARLYLADGNAVQGDGPWVFETEAVAQPDGRHVPLIVDRRHFATEAEASAYLMERKSAHLTMGCLDPARSCVPLAALAGLKRVFSSDASPIAPGVPVTAVKVFEVAE